MRRQQRDICGGGSATFAAAAAMAAMAEVAVAATRTVVVSESLQDVVLVSSDGQESRSWAVVLSTASALLRDVISSMAAPPTPDAPARIPVDVRGRVMEAIIDVLHSPLPPAPLPGWTWVNLEDVTMTEIGRAADYLRLDPASLVYDVCPHPHLIGVDSVRDALMATLKYGWPSADSIVGTPGSFERVARLTLGAEEWAAWEILAFAEAIPEIRDDPVLWARAEWACVQVCLVGMYRGRDRVRDIHATLPRRAAKLCLQHAVDDAQMEAAIEMVLRVGIRSVGVDVIADALASSSRAPLSFSKRIMVRVFEKLHEVSDELSSMPSYSPRRSPSYSPRRSRSRSRSPVHHPPSPLH